MNDRKLLDHAQSVIPCFEWRFITTEQFGTGAVVATDIINGFVFMTETEFWLDQKSGQLTLQGEPILSARQRAILSSAIELSEQHKVHDCESVMCELFE